MPAVSFQTTHENEGARAGTINTSHGAIETPAFLFCATRASLKSLSVTQIKSAGTPALLCNTYHLMLRPGSEFIKKMGGLHKFMGWDGPTFMDSGGYQIFGLGHGSVSDEIKGVRHGRKSLLKIDEDGASFSSYIDGSRVFLSPEKSIQIQRDLGTDIVFVLDECTPFHVDKLYTEKSMHMSHRWEERSFREFAQHDDGSQGLYGIIQGGVHPDLRRESIDFVNSIDFFGRAIGGSLGSTKSQMYEVIEMAMDGLRRDGPIHLLGIGGIGDIFEGVSQGIDTFDCVHPTRIARHAGALIDVSYWIDANENFHTREHIDLSKACFENDNRPILANCPCETCTTYSRAYLHYLIKAKEMLYISAITIHNVCYMNRLMAAIRETIKSSENDLMKLKKLWTPL